MRPRSIVLICATVVAALAAPAASAGASSPARRGGDNSYRLHKLVADQPGEAAQVDPNLVNAWGLVAGPSTPWWVADNETDVSTLYDGGGNVLPLVVKVVGGPTGTVFNGTTSFVVSHQDASGASLFLFATERGTIRGWNPAVPMPAPSTRSFTVADRSEVGADYKGLAIASTPKRDLLYAADFHNARVDVFDGSFDLVERPGAFEDPDLPAGFAPFGIQAIGNRVVVTYAMQDADAEDEVAGPGLGYVDVFRRRGDLVGRVASEGVLNAPWGIAMAPADFGAFGGDLLVGNFGDGTINAFAPTAAGTYEPAGTLMRASGKVLAIDGLWALEFGNGGAAGPTTSLFFTAGPQDETHGLFGKIEAHVPPPA
jgi:uncharacterized protein (TIGR03118 family)